MLAAADIHAAAAAALTSIYPHLPPTERGTIETAILAVPEELGAEYGERVRNRLLVALGPPDSLLVDAAREIASRLSEEQREELQERPSGFSGLTTMTVTDEMFLAEKGVPVDAAPNRSLRELERPVKEFALRAKQKHHAEEGEWANGARALEALKQALLTAVADGAHPTQVESSWTSFAEACTEIAEAGEGPAFEAVRPLLRDCLLLAAETAEAGPAKNSSPQFDKHPSWSPNRHNSAAAGLCALAWHQTDPAILEAIERLSRHTSYDVRHQVAWRSRSLSRNAPDLMWRIAERLANEECSPGVLQGLLSSMQRLAGVAPDRVTGLATAIYGRFRSHPSAAGTRELCIGIFVGLHVWRGQEACGAVLDEIVRDPLGHTEEAGHIPFALREALTHGSAPNSSAEDEATRQRAVRLMVTLAERATGQLQHLRQQFGAAPVTEADQKRAQALMHLLDGLGSEVYFASGAFSDKSGQDDDKPLAPDALRRFYRELRPVIATSATPESRAWRITSWKFSRRWSTWIPLLPSETLPRSFEARKGVATHTNRWLLN